MVEMNRRSVLGGLAATGAADLMLITEDGAEPINTIGTNVVQV